MTIVKENIKKGLILLLIYSIITLCLFMAGNRIQRLETATVLPTQITSEI